MTPLHRGSCHCGGVIFTIAHEPIELTTCDCSLCVKRNALMAKVPETALRVEQGQSLLMLYEWNSRRAKHFFCKCCGIYVFHRKRAAPDHFGINIFCLDGYDASVLPVRPTDGAQMNLVGPDSRPEWPGPRASVTSISGGATMSLIDVLVPTYTQMLRMLAGLLEKASQQEPEGEADTLLALKLAPDMLPLSSQIRFACLQAHEGVLRLAGRSFPASVEQLDREGRRADDQPGSVAEAQMRISETLSFLGSAGSHIVEGADDQTIAIELPDGQVFEMTRQQYVRDWALPQFYFHVVTAYAILRGRGIRIGKADYVPHMLAYLRGSR